MCVTKQAKVQKGLRPCRTTKQKHSVQVGEAIQTEQRPEDKVMWHRTGDSVIAHGTVVDEVIVFPRGGRQPGGVPFTTGIQHGTNTVVVSAVDMDVVVIFVRLFFCFTMTVNCQVWVTLGRERNKTHRRQRRF